jgi:hypothetical protein
LDSLTMICHLSVTWKNDDLRLTAFFNTKNPVNVEFKGFI